MFAPLVAFTIHDSGREPLFSFVWACVGVAYLWTVVLGVLLEIPWPQHRATRWTSLAIVTVIIAGVVLDPPSPGSSASQHLVLMVPLIVAAFFGAVAFGYRWRAWRRLLRHEDGLVYDAEQGVVRVHRGPARDFVASGAKLPELTIDVWAPDAEVTIELLPTSSFVYAVDGTVVDRWATLPSVEVASRDGKPAEPDGDATAVREESPDTQWVGIAPSAQTGAGAAIAERPLRTAEEQELGRRVRDARRGVVGAFLLAGWVTGVVLRAVMSYDGVGLSPIQWVVAACVGVAAGGLVWWRVRWVAQDLKAGVVLVIRPDVLHGDPTRQGEVIEVLASSESLWTENGVPAPWRTLPE